MKSILCDCACRKWQQISSIQKIALRNENIHRVVEDDDTDGRDVAQVLGHIIEVDLQDNLLWQWKEVRPVSQRGLQYGVI